MVHDLDELVSVQMVDISMDTVEVVEDHEQVERVRLHEQVVDDLLLSKLVEHLHLILQA